jgi:predicted phosphodiesterase
VRIALLSDVHGNPDALGAALRTLRRCDVTSWHFLGDAVGYLPGESECLDVLGELDAGCQKGNHEAMLLSPTPAARELESVYGLQAARTRLDSAEIDWIRSWPEVSELRIEGRRLLLVHGSPTEPLTGYLYPDTDLDPYADRSFDAIVCAHTHRPFMRTAAGTRIINVGSVGLPRDVGRLASVATYDSDANEFEIWRIPFDAERVIDRWGSALHEQTVACLRRNENRFVGHVIT